MALMTIRSLSLSLGLVVGLSACARKPSEEECKVAVENIRKLTGQTHSEGGVDPKAAIRSCRSHSTLETVKCQTAAKTLDEMAACEGEEGKRMLKEQEEREAERRAKQADEAAKQAPPPATTAPDTPPGAGQ